MFHCDLAHDDMCFDKNIEFELVHGIWTVKKGYEGLWRCKYYHPEIDDCVRPKACADKYTISIDYLDHCDITDIEDLYNYDEAVAYIESHCAKPYDWVDDFELVDCSGDRYYIEEY